METRTGFGGFHHAPRQEINLVPFIDILLVLVVVFMVASPMLTHAVRVELPRASSHPESEVPASLSIEILADGSVLWEGQAIATGELEERIRSASIRTPDPALRILADSRTEYVHVAQAMSAAAKAGIARFSFSTSPSGTTGGDYVIFRHP